MTSTAKPAAPAKKAAAPAKKAAAKPAAEKPAAKAKEPKEPAAPTYREHEDFVPAFKAAKAAAKGNDDMTQALQLLGHLSWKTPGGSVGWAAGTTKKVTDYAEDILVMPGQDIPEAMDTVLGVATKAAADKPQKDAIAVLSKVVKSHS